MSDRITLTSPNSSVTYDSGGYGVSIYNGAIVTNPGTGTFSGVNSGIVAIGANYGVVSVINAGTITASGTLGAGVYLRSGGTVTNLSTGMIGGEFGIQGLAQMTVVNAGSISGTYYAVRLSGSAGDLLVIDPGASFTGQVEGAGATPGTGRRRFGRYAVGVRGAVHQLHSGHGGCGRRLDFRRHRHAGRRRLPRSDRRRLADQHWHAGQHRHCGRWNARRSEAVGGRRAGQRRNRTGLGDAIYGYGTGSETITNAGTIMADGNAILQGSGTVTNLGGGMIGGNYGIRGGNLTVGKAGSIIGNAATGDGVYLHSGSVTNQAGGAISGNDAIFSHLAGTVVNAGGIAGNMLSGGAGVFLLAGGSVTNQANGTISGFRGGLGSDFYNNDAPVVFNASSITGDVSNGFGVYFRVGGSLANQSGGMIGGQYGFFANDAATTIVNAGSIAGGMTNGFGVRLQAGGSVANQRGGTISGNYGIYSNGGAMSAVNAGSIAEATEAVKFGAGVASRLVIDPGAAFTGTVDGGNLIGAAVASTLELAAGASAGALLGLGTQFIDFAQVTIDAAASWTLIGANTLAAGATLANAGTLTLSNASLNAATLVNDGGITLDPSTLVVGSLSSTGSVTIAAGSTLEVRGSVSSFQTIVFGGAGAYLHVDAPDSFVGSTANFSGEDAIDLKGVGPASVRYATGLLSYGTAGGAIALSVSPATTLTIAASTDGAAAGALCFCANTLIQTPKGERAVQALAVGDWVSTHGGGPSCGSASAGRLPRVAGAALPPR